MLDELISVMKLQGKLPECASVMQELFQHLSESHGPHSTRALKLQVRPFGQLVASSNDVVPDKTGDDVPALQPPRPCRGHPATSAGCIAAISQPRQPRNAGLFIQPGVSTQAAGAA